MGGGIQGIFKVAVPAYAWKNFSSMKMLRHSLSRNLSWKLFKCEAQYKNTGSGSLI